MVVHHHLRTCFLESLSDAGPDRSGRSRHHDDTLSKIDFDHRSTLY